MRLDIERLREFYFETRLGRIVRRVLREQVSRIWPDTRGQTVAGFGFAVPLLSPFLAKSRRVLCLLSARQGVLVWPETGEPRTNRSILVEETGWPLSTGLIDRLIVLHGLENSDDHAALLDEIWRTLGPGGRVVFIVPNRTGLWARRDVTPFGFGRPYSLMQLEALLEDHRFSPERHISALFMPPSHKKFWLRTARYWEGFSHQFPAPFAAGVLIVEAAKRQQAPVAHGLGAVVRTRLEGLDGMIKPKGPVTGHTGRVKRNSGEHGTRRS